MDVRFMKTAGLRFKIAVKDTLQGDNNVKDLYLA